MSALHYETLGIALGAVALISIFVFGSLWRINQELPGLGFWFAASLLVGLGFVVLFFKPVLGEAFMVINNAAAMGGALLMLEGILRFGGLGQARRRRYALGAAALLIVTLAVINRNDSVRRFLMHDALLALMCLASAGALVWRVRGRRLVIQGIAAASFTLLAGVFLRRWLLAWDSPPGADLTQHPWMAMVFGATFLHAVVWVEMMNLAVNQRVQERLRHMALRDELTQLPNRRAFGEAVRLAEARARRTGGSFAVVMMDLDGFKPVNDRHGHDAGDALLQAVAQRVRAVLRGGDIVCRVGGDEFIALLDDCPDADRLALAIGRMQGALEPPLELLAADRPVTLHPRASLGGALYPADARDIDSLLKVADQRMYQNKTTSGQPRAAATAA